MGGLTLNIIEHELERFGKTTRLCVDNPSFEKARVYLSSSAALPQDALLVCSEASDSAYIVEAGACSLLICKPGCLDGNVKASLVLEAEQDVLEIFDGLLETFYCYGDWERSMDALVAKEEALQELVDVSSKFLRNNLVVVDPALKLIAYTKDNPCDDPITMELIEHGYHTEENIRKFKLHKRFRPWAETRGFIVNDSREICKYTTVVRSFKTSHSFSLIIVMMCNVCDPEPYLFDIYDMFAERVRRFAVRDYPDDKPSGNAADTFIRSLLLGELTDRKAIKERCKHVGIPFEARFCLFFVDVPKDSIPLQRLLADLSTTVAPAKSIAVSGGIAILCFNCLSDHCALRCESGTCPSAKVHRSISSRIEQTMEKCGLICGRGSKFKYLYEAMIAFEQAKKACELGKLKAQVKPGVRDFINWKRIFSFERCFAEYLVQQMGSGSSLALCTYGGRVIDAMAQRDEQTGSDDYEFLFEYLVNERKPSVVADRLFMHRNNVKYRIDKIEERFGIDTSDPSLRLMILFAYKLREASKAL